MIVRLTRGPSTPDGTFGHFVGFDFDFYSLEKPWVDLNGDGQGDPDTSCITVGSYKCLWLQHPTHGWCYEVTGVKGRSNILIHAANWEHELLGCIALGTSRGVLLGVPAILHSGDAIREFHRAMAKQPFTLEITQ